MSAGPARSTSLHERIAGKWQIPLFAAAAILLGLVAVQVKSPDRKLTAEQHVAQVRTLNDLALFARAKAQAERVIAWPDLAKETNQALLLEIARAEYGLWQSTNGAGEARGEEVVAAYDRAQQAEVTLVADDYRKLADVFERLRRFELAAKYHGLAAENDVPPALADRRRVIELSIYPLNRPQVEIDALLEAFIADAESDAKQLLWALSQRIEALAGTGQADRSAALLEKYRDRFIGDALQGEYSFLAALGLRGAGRYDEAERVLRELLNRVSISDPVFPKAGWLLGSVVMFDGQAQRPEEAIAILREVIASRANLMYVAASRVALADALATMRRFDEAVTAYQETIDELGRVPFNRLVNPDTLRASIAITADRAAANGQLAVAVVCERMALHLVEDDDTETLNRHFDRLANAQVRQARGMLAEAEKARDEPKDNAPTRAAQIADARKLLVAAGENHVRRAWLNTLNERRSSAAMWTAAGLFDEAEDHERAIKLLSRFVKERPDAEIISQALLRLGRSLQAEGRYDEAITAYQRNLSTHPRSPFANAALIPLAECFMALGEGHEQDAETALRQIIDDSTIFTPAAPEYRDALYLLSDLFSRQDRYEDTIATLDEFLQRYPDDPRRPRALFRMAHAYFNSADDIKAELLKPEFAGERKRLDAERSRRLTRAADLYREVVDALERRADANLDQLERVYLQDARLYEAACRYEQGDIREALALYERAAWLYKESPAALGAYVQVINCDLSLGRREEAQTALRRAQFLVDSIADERFASVGGIERRDEWRKYFDWVQQTLVED